jgi:transcriptional regulator with XRE-family HTH domain
LPACGLRNLFEQRETRPALTTQNSRHGRCGNGDLLGESRRADRLLSEVVLKQHFGTLPYGKTLVKAFCQSALLTGIASRQNVDMTTPKETAGMPLPKVRAARERLKLSLEALAHDIGISTSQLSRIETGEREARVGEVKRLSSRLNVPIAELVGDEFAPRCPVVGLANAGSDSVIFSEGQGPFEYVEPPEGSSKDTVAVEVRGKSLGEIFDGWLVFYDDVRTPPTPQMMNQLCVAELDDGRVVVKRITRGQRRDRFNLSSNVEPPIYDAKIAWAARVIAMKPK